MPFDVDPALATARSRRPRSRELARAMKEGVDPHSVNDDGMTPLMLAVTNGHVDVVRHLLPRSDVNAQAHRHRMSPLMLAASNLTALNGALVLHNLLDAGADPGLRDGKGRTALHHAAGTSQNHAFMDLPEPDENRIWFGAQKGFQALLDVSDAKACDHHGETPLMRAASYGDVAWVKALLPFSDVNARTDTGWTALMGAALKGNDEGVERLLKAGADRALRDHQGCTAAHAALRGTASIVSFDRLTGDGVDLALRLNDDSSTLEWAALRMDRRFLERVVALAPRTLAQDGAEALTAALEQNMVVQAEWLNERLPLAVVAQVLTLGRADASDDLWVTLHGRHQERERAVLHAQVGAASEPPLPRARL